MYMYIEFVWGFNHKNLQIRKLIDINLDTLHNNENVFTYDVKPCIEESQYRFTPLNEL